jgi:N-acetylneuraminate synthase
MPSNIVVVGEIGINHNGSVEIAKQLIDMAVDCGCDAVKFQKRTIELVYSPEELARPRESPWGTTNGDQKRGLEFGRDEYDEIDAYCLQQGIDWFASAWDFEALAFLHAYDLKYNKIASAMVTNEPFLRVGGAVPVRPDAYRVHVPYPRP